MHKYCSVCSASASKSVNIDMYYSKLKQSKMDNKYVCFECFKNITAEEEDFVKSQMDNLPSIIKNRYLEEYIKPPEPIITNNTNVGNINATASNINTSNTTINYITNTTRPIKVYKLVKRLVDGIERDMVLIDLEDYRLATGDYRPSSVFENLELKEKELKREETQKERELKEIKIIERLEELDKRDKIKSNEPELKARREVEIAASRNKLIRQRKQELLDEYKHIPNAKIETCKFCKEYKVYPIHYLDDDNNKFLINYTKYDDGKRTSYKSYGCIDCYDKELQKKEEMKLKYTEYCHICKCQFTAVNEDDFAKHMKSAKHNKNIELQKLKKLEEDTPETEKPKIDLSKLNIRQLYLICSKSLNDDGTYRINNYTKISKKELLEKMNENYGFLVLT